MEDCLEEEGRLGLLLIFFFFLFRKDFTSLSSSRVNAKHALFSAQTTWYIPSGDCCHLTKPRADKVVEH